MSQKAKNKVSKVIFQILAVLPFIIVSAIRYDVGTDYFVRYVPNYMEFVNNRPVPSLEPLFVIIIKLCIFVTSNPTILFVITSIIINALVFYTIFKYSKKPVLSVIIYFLGSFYFASMNIVRQYLAMMVLLASYRILLSNKNKYLYLLMIFISTLFHTMSIVFVITLFLDKKPIKLKLLFVMLIVFAIVGTSLGDIVSYIINNTGLQNNVNIYKYVKYFVKDGQIYLSTIVSEIFIYIFIYESYITLKNKGETIEKEAIFFLNMQSMVLVTIVLSIYYSLFFRITILFSMFQIISIPYFWSKLSAKESKRLTVQTKSTVLMLAIVGLLFVRMVYSNIFVGNEEVLPYKTVFEVEDVTVDGGEQ